MAPGKFCGECEILAKLLGMLVQHWLVLLAGPWLDGKTASAKVRRTRRLLVALANALPDVTCVASVLVKIHEVLHRLRPRNPRKQQPLTID